MIGEIGAERLNARGILRTEVHKRQEHSGVGMQGIQADETDQGSTAPAGATRMRMLEQADAAAHAAWAEVWDGSV